jgi:hypothetical protein
MWYLDCCQVTGWPLATAKGCVFDDADDHECDA